MILLYNEESQYHSRFNVFFLSLSSFFFRSSATAIISVACFFTDGPSDVVFSAHVDDVLLSTHLQLTQALTLNVVI